MKLRLPHIRKLARLFAGAFAVQVIAAGACLMAPAAYAMPMLATATVMSHCDGMDMNASASDHAMPMHGDKSACPHCDQPDSMSLSQSFIDHAPVAIALPAVEPESTAKVASAPAFAMRTPTGPPRSASLIYQTTQRIRI